MRVWRTVEHMRDFQGVPRTPQQARCFWLHQRVQGEGLDFAELSSVFITCLGSLITVFHQRPLLEKHASMPQSPVHLALQAILQLNQPRASKYPRIGPLGFG